MEKIQAFLSGHRTSIYLGLYTCCIVPSGIFLISLAGVYYNSCSPVALWSMIYGLFIILAPLLLIPPMIYLKLSTKIYTYIVSFLTLLGYTALFIAGIVLIIKSSWSYGCMYGGGLALWSVALLTILFGLISTAGSVFTLYGMWKAAENRETTEYYYY